MKEELRKVGLTTLAAAIGLVVGASTLAQERPGAPGADPRDDQSAEQADQRDVQEPGGAAQAGQEDQDQAQDQGQQAAAGEEAEIDTLSERNEDLSQFVEALKAAGLGDALTGGTEYTVFAPTNEALEQMQGQSLEELMAAENREQLIRFLRAHIVADQVDAEMAQQIPAARTIDGGTVQLSSEDGKLMVGDASVVESGISVGSLTVHAIDGVIEPQGEQVAAAQEPDQGQQDPQSQRSPGQPQSPQGEPN